MIIKDTRKNSLKIYLSLFFTGLLLFPPIFFYTFHSLTHGLIIFSILMIFLIFFFNRQLFSLSFLNFFFKFYSWVFFFIFFHFLILSFFYSNISYSRFLFSFIAIAIFFFGSALFAFYLIKSHEKKYFDKALKIVFYILLFLIFLGLLRYSTISPFYYQTDIYLTIFAEPSHLTIAILPLIFYFILSSNNARSRFKLLILFFIISLLIKSATLLIGILLCFLLNLSIRGFIFILTSLVIVYLISNLLGLYEYLKTVPDFKYFYDRILLNAYSGGKPNMSVLVYLANYHELYLNLIKSFFFGIGFQQYGFTGATSFYREIIFYYSGSFEYIHNKDSSFLLGKFISEFGIFGIFCTLYYFKLFYINARNLRNKFSKYNNLNIFFSSCIISFLLELLVRGAGYFTVSIFLLFASLFGQKLLMYYDKKN